MGAVYGALNHTLAALKTRAARCETLPRSKEGPMIKYDLQSRNQLL